MTSPINVTENDTVLDFGQELEPLEIPLAQPFLEESVKQTRPATGAATPSLTEFAQAQTGELTGAAGAGAQEFGKGFIGTLFDYGFGDYTDLAEEELERESLSNYARLHPVKDISSRFLSRAVSDSPVDMVIGMGMTRAGIGLARMLKMKGGYATSAAKLEDAVKIAREYQKGVADAGLMSRSYSNSVEGLIGGVASEGIIQAFGREGDAGDIVFAGIGDAIASPFISEAFRGLGKTLGWSADKFFKDTANTIQKDVESQGVFVDAREVEQQLRERFGAILETQGQGFGGKVQNGKTEATSIDTAFSLLKDVDKEVDAKQVEAIHTIRQKYEGRTSKQAKDAEGAEIKAVKDRKESDVLEGYTAVADELVEDIIRTNPDLANIDRDSARALAYEALEAYEPGEVGKRQSARIKKQQENIAKVRAENQRAADRNLTAEDQGIARASDEDAIRANEDTDKVGQAILMNEFKTTLFAKLQGDVLRVDRPGQGRESVLSLENLDAQRQQSLDDWVTKKVADLEGIQAQRLEAEAREFQEALKVDKLSEEELMALDEIELDNINSIGQLHGEIKRKAAKVDAFVAESRRKAKAEQAEATRVDKLTVEEQTALDILEGEADFQVGVRQRAANSRATKKQHQQKVLTRAANRLTEIKKELSDADIDIEALASTSNRDIKILSEQTGVDAKLLRTLRNQEKMKQRVEAERLEVEDADLQARNKQKERLNALQSGIIPAAHYAGHVDIRAKLENSDFVTNAEEFRTMARLFGIREYYIDLSLELLSVRAKMVGKSLDEWLAFRKLKYRTAKGTPEVLFHDMATVLSAPRAGQKAAGADKRAADFFHEIGHLLEVDLDVKTRRAFAKHYGVKEKDLFSEGVSEQFANDFLKWVRDVQDGKTSDLPEGLQGAFTRVARWLRDIFSSLIKKNSKLPNEIRDMFDGLFLKEGTDKLRVGKFESFVDNLEGTTRQATPESSVNIADSTLIALGDSDLDPKQTRQDLFRQREDIKTANEELHSDANNFGNKDNFIGKMINSKWVPGFFTSGIMTPQTILENLGPTFAKSWEKLSEGIGKVTELKSRYGRLYSKIAEQEKFSKEDFIDMSRVVKFQGEKLKVYDIVTLNRYANDGMSARNEFATNSASASLIAKEGGYELPSGKVVTFTRDEVREMATDAWLSQTAGADSAVRGKDVIDKMLKVAGKDFLEFHSARDGDANSPPFDIETGYFMKRIKGMSTEPIELDITKNGNMDGRLLYRTIADNTALNHVRQGTGVLQAQNPFLATVGYTDQLARLQGLGDSLAETSLIVGGNRGAITKFAGEGIYKALEDALTKAAGNSQWRDPVAGKIWSKLYKNQVMAALSWNPVTPIKQIPSIIAGMIELNRIFGDNIPNTTANMSKYMTIAFNDRKTLHADMMEKFDTYFDRYMRAGQSPDLSDINMSDSFATLTYDDINVKDALDAGGVGGVANKIVENGMAGIRGADANVIRAMYLATMDGIGIKKEIKDLSPEEVQQIEGAMVEVINNSQPTYDPLTRSMVQNSNNILTRQFAMFSSQQTKNFNYWLKDMIASKNGDEEAAKRASKTMYMLAYQSAAIAAIGTIAGYGKSFALDQISNEEYLAQRDAYLESHGKNFHRVFNESYGAFFGNLPFAGPVVGELFKAATIQDSWDLEIMPINYINDTINLMESLGEESMGRSTKDFVRTLGEVTGVPNLFTQIGTKASTNF